MKKNDKIWKNGVKIWKKFATRIRIIEFDDKFNVEIRNKYNRNWHKLRDFKTFKEALCQKHFYMKTLLFKDFGIRSKYNIKSKKKKS